MDVSGFGERSQFHTNEFFLTEVYHGYENWFDIIVKSMKVSMSVENAHVDRRIEELKN
jgi:hypothetical protein